MKLKTILIIVVCALAGVALCYIIGSLGENLFTPLTAQINGWLGGFDVGSVVSNPATIIAMVGTGASVATPLLAKLSTAKQQATELKEQAATQISGLTGQLDTATGKLSSTETSLASLESKFNTLQSQTSTYQTQAASYKEQLDKLTSQYTELQKIKAADLIGSLPGGSTIRNPDGSTTTVVERTLIK